MRLPPVEEWMMGQFIDRSGHRFGSLTAVRPTSVTLSSGRKMPAWRLKCDCGSEVVAMTVNLSKGKHRSCGCKRVEHIQESSGHLGVTRHPEYQVYRQMRDRCYLSTATNYRHYGALGVTVCDRWRHGEGGKTGYQCFIEDMGRRPDGLTLDRIDPYGNYQPDNCRWATWCQQQGNKRATCRSGASDVYGSED